MTDVVEGMASDPQPEPVEAPDGASPDSGVESADESQPGPIPYERFKDVNEQKNTAQQAAQAATAEANQLRGQLQQAAAMIEASRQQQPTPQVADEDPDLALARSKFGQDDVGQQTFDAVASVVKALAKENKGGLTEEQTREIAMQAAGGVRQELNSGMAMTNGMNDLVTQNNLTQKEAQAFHASIASKMQDPQFAQSAKDAKNVPWILKGTLMDLSAEGSVKLGRQPRAQNGNVLQPGGNGAAPSIQEELKPEDNPLPAVRGLSPERMKEVYELSKANHGKAMRQ